MRQETSSASYSWLFDLLFSQPPSVTWAPAGQLPAGARGAERFAVLPAGGERTFMVPLASRRGAWSAVTSYNGLRPARRRLERRALGLAFLTGLAGPLTRETIEVSSAGAAKPGTPLGEHLAALFGESRVVMAFGGGSGPYKKPVLQVFGTGGTPLGYVKVGWNAWTRDAVRREAAALRACATAGGGLGAPALLHHGTWRDLELVVTAPLPSGVRRPARPPEVGLLREICELAPVSRADLADSGWWTDLRDRVSALADGESRARLTAVVDEIEAGSGGPLLEFGCWHGDLVPWNLARLGSRLFAWDWESSAMCAPVGFDALHYHFQVAFVAQRRPAREAAALGAANAGPALAALGVPAAAHGLLAMLHLVELALRHEEARDSSGEADDRFFPEVLGLLGEPALVGGVKGRAA